MPLLVTCKRCGEQSVWAAAPELLAPLEALAEEVGAYCKTCMSRDFDVRLANEEDETRGAGPQ